MSPDFLIRVSKPMAHRRACMGLYLNGPMPTIRQIQRDHGMRKSAACEWHRKIARARREFGAST